MQIRKNYLKCATFFSWKKRADVDIIKQTEASTNVLVRQDLCNFLRTGKIYVYN